MQWKGLKEIVHSRSSFKKRSLVMRKYCCIPVLTCLGLTVGLGSNSASAQVISEAFDNIAALPAADWFMINHSTTIGTTNWFQGNTTVFAPQASAGYIAANFNNTTATNTISNWLLAPQKPLTNGMKL